ncbi:hypothetical protein EV684_105155 [Rubrivivax gelatinosus]|uniref:Uncharacterized protein n=1 Tax=Rubrivivax gelatinosus TaxID=28068 RepID=A0A4R2M6T1_RUBGE|nr:hypothetical protein EV684_105155 [Rubrivivax gelatinosus]
MPSLALPAVDVAHATSPFFAPPAPDARRAGEGGTMGAPSRGPR